MKSKLWTLFKTTTINNYNTNKRFTGKNVGKTVRGGITTGIVLILILALSGLYSYMLTSFLHTQGLERYVIVGFSLVAVIASFMTTINRAKGTLFDSRDNDMLFAMPIKFSTILSNRVLNLLTINYLTVAAIFIPTLVVYSLFVPVGIMYYVMGIIIYLFLPLIPTVLASIIGYIIAYITSKLGGKKIIEVVFTLIFFVVIFVASMQLQNIAMSVLNHVGSIDLFISKYLFVIDFLQQALINNNIVYFLLYVLTNIVVFGLFVLVLAKGYNKIIGKLKEAKTSKKHGNISYSSSTKVVALLKKEFRKLISTPVYLLNSTIGIVLLLLATVATVFSGSKGLEQILEIPNAGSYMTLIVMGIAGFLVTMTDTTLCSISLEGQSFWIVKSLPVTEKEILNSKILLNILVVVPIAIICVIIFGITLSLGIINTILIAVFVTILSLVISHFGLISNLLFPKLKYESEIQAIKQSMSSFIAIFVPMILFFVVGAVVAALSTFMSIRILIVITIVVLAIIFIIERILVNTWGIKKLRSIN